MLAKHFSITITNLTKQVFLVFFVLFSLFGAVFSGAAPSESTESPKLKSLDNGHFTVQQLLQHITALERVFEKESHAIAELNERIDRLEAKYLEVKSSIEQTIGIQSVNESTLPVQRAQPAQSVQPPAQVAVIADDTGYNLENDVLSHVALGAYETFAIGGFLAILLLLLTLRIYQRKREKAAILDESDFLEAEESVDKEESGEKSLKAFQKLSALKKAVQNKGSKDELTIVIRQDEYKQNANKSVNSAIADARLFIEQGQPEFAIKLLESFLAKNKHSEIGWQMFFKILHDQKLNTEFRKQALRFKRMEQFPETWTKIQSWGHALEPDEPLYMSEQEKKKRFFSN